MSLSASPRKLPRYTSNTLELQTLKLADYAFLLRDYSTALSNYRQAGTEFKGDKAWRHYALSQDCAHIREGLGKGREKG